VEAQNEVKEIVYECWDGNSEGKRAVWKAAGGSDFRRAGDLAGF
jgi:hypothetical protein